LQSLLLQVDIPEIIVHKTNQPDTIVDLLDTHGLTCDRSSEIDFLFVDANSSPARAAISSGCRLKVCRKLPPSGRLGQRIWCIRRAFLLRSLPRGS